MAVSSNASATFNLPAQVISIKLDGTNFLAWSAQLIPLFRRDGLMGIVNGSNPYPPQYSSDELCDQERHPPTELAAMVAEANTTYLNQHQWYVDSGVNIHVTSDVVNLAISQPYEGIDTIGIGNGAVKASTTTWHCRLGHPSSSTLHNVLHNYSLPVSDSFNKKYYLCDVSTSRKVINYPIKQLQSDNGGEYYSTIFKQFLSDNGFFIGSLVRIPLNKMTLLRGNIVI
uniref:GAG-pre-integrase domain-containing protein n=1 Tax=Vitis vinifera TaxID=29760 RepID=A5C9K7_VITVI|nr:hypothetical protein VITISV_035779 [Vitis vinifera]